MVVKTLEKRVIRTIYEAIDGTQFEDEKECLEYENNLLIRKEWDDKKFSVEIDGKEWQYYFVYSDESLVTLFNYLSKFEDVHVNHYDFTEIFKQKSKYVGHWVTYSYDRDMTYCNFYLYTLEEREELALEKISDLQEELEFYKLIKGMNK